MILWNKTGVLLAAALLLGGLVAGQAEGRGKRLTQLPNGGVVGCNTCHIGGGGSPGGMMSARGAADFLTRATRWLAGGFVVLSIVLAAMAVDMVMSP